ncbi:hypothetical protein [Roseibium sp.]
MASITNTGDCRHFLTGQCNVLHFGVLKEQVLTLAWARELLQSKDK